MTICQPMVMISVSPFHAELTSTIGPGSRKRRMSETGKSRLVYSFMVGEGWFFRMRAEMLIRKRILSTVGRPKTIGCEFSRGAGFGKVPFPYVHTHTSRGAGIILPFPARWHPLLNLVNSHLRRKTTQRAESKTRANFSSVANKLPTNPAWRRLPVRVGDGGTRLVGAAPP